MIDLRLNGGGSSHDEAMNTILEIGNRIMNKVLTGFFYFFDIFKRGSKFM